MVKNGNTNYHIHYNKHKAV